MAGLLGVESRWTLWRSSLEGILRLAVGQRAGPDPGSINTEALRFDNADDRSEAADNRTLQMSLHVCHKLFLVLKARLDWLVRVLVNVVKVRLQELIYGDTKRLQAVQENVVLEKFTLICTVDGCSKEVLRPSH